MYPRTLALAAFAFAAASANAAEFVPGSEVTVQGTVSGFHSQRAFWMDVDGDRVLVYGTQAQRASLHRGLQLRVEGSVSDDFMKFAEVELTARRIERVRAGGTTTAAMPNP